MRITPQSARIRRTGSGTSPDNTGTTRERAGMTAALPRTTPRNASIPRSPACITRPLVRNTTAVVGITIQPAVHGDERSGECPVEIFVMRAGTWLCATPSLVMPAGSFVMQDEPGVMHSVAGPG